MTERPRKTRRRYEIPGIRFLTFSCYQHCPFFDDADLRDMFANRLEALHCKRAFRLYAWVIMPDHVHLLAAPALPAWPVARILQVLKQPAARRALARWRTESCSPPPRFWQAGGGYDRNIYTSTEFREKLNYMHENPVRRGLVVDRCDWAWSSARWYAGDRTGPVAIDPIDDIELSFPGSATHG